MTKPSFPGLAVSALGALAATALSVTPGTSAVGEGVTSFKPGDPVLAITTYGAFAEEVKTEARRLMPIPDGMDFVPAGPRGGPDYAAVVHP